MHTTDLPTPVNHVFVDFENVHEVDRSIIGRKAVDFTLLLGAHQTKLDVTLVEKLLEHAASVQLVRVTSTGKNALDFTLAYYVGRAVAGDPTGSFHIVSKDTGFDALVDHLRSKHIRARRHDDFATLGFSGAAKPPTPLPDELLDRAMEHLRKTPTCRPKRKKTLVSHLLASLGNNTTESDVQSLIENLRQKGRLTIDEKDAVSYSLEPK